MVPRCLTPADDPGRPRPTRPACLPRAVRRSPRKKLTVSSLVTVTARCAISALPSSHPSTYRVEAYTRDVVLQLQYHLPIGGFRHEDMSTAAIFICGNRLFQYSQCRYGLTIR